MGYITMPFKVDLMESQVIEEVKSPFTPSNIGEFDLKSMEIEDTTSSSKISSDTLMEVAEAAARRKRKPESELFPADPKGEEYLCLALEATDGVSAAIIGRGGKVISVPRSRS